MPMTYAETEEALATTLGDAENVTFTPEEKTRALTKAWNDPYVSKTIWDTSVTFAYSTYQYAIPDTLTTVKDIYIRSSNTADTFPRKIDGSLWEVVNGNIQFGPAANAYIPSTYGLFLKGTKKLTTSDTLVSTTMDEYVIALAGYNTLILLGHKKVNLFLKNDTTMSELIALKREFERDVVNLRSRLAREYESA